jgi:hypothetical protein
MNSQTIVFWLAGERSGKRFTPPSQKFSPGKSPSRRR